MLEWRNNSLPVSMQFDDPYYSKEDGRAETDHVFIKGNQLHKRWPHMAVCSIAELGFGTGLNFLETLRQWQAYKPDGAMLHFISFEQFPLADDEMRRALSNWPELISLGEKLLDIWKPDKTIDTSITDDVRLTVHMSDANELLPKLFFKADAWYLDGFSPAKNPELWNETLMACVGRNTVAGGTFATYTAAGFVKRNLQAAGFDVNKTSGFGTKRDMLIGKMRSDINVA